MKIDSKECKNIFNNQPEVVSKLEKRLENLVNDMNIEETSMSPEELQVIEKRLKGLGYL
jgi:hypothetical protein